MAKGGEADEEAEDAKSLLSTPSSSSSSSAHSPTQASAPPPRDPSSPRTPRTANRVRFQLDDPPVGRHDGRRSRHARDESTDWLEHEDYLTSPSSSLSNGMRRDSTGHRVPLLTDIEAPSVTLASADDDDDFNAEDHLESARPKSGMRSAFMNMANSIM